MWHHLEGKATAALKLQSDPSAASSPPPQFEQRQEEEHLPDVTLSETTVVKAADDNSNVHTDILLSPPPLLEPIVEVSPIEDSVIESLEMTDEPINSPSSLSTSSGETPCDDTVDEVQAQATTAPPVALSPVTPAESKAPEIIDEMPLPEPVVPLPPPPAAETARRPRSMKCDMALILNDENSNHHTRPLYHLHQEKSEGAELDRLPNTPTESAPVATGEKP